MTTPREPMPPLPDPGDVPPGRPLHDVFVSYSTNDKPVADAIVARLEQAAIRCWVAPRDVIPGQVWGEAILTAIESSRLMVVVLSDAANQSRQVVREVERAVANNVVVVPFRIDASEPTGAMAYFLASEHWLDAMTPPLEAHVSQLVSVVRALLGAAVPPAGVPAPVPPPAGVPAPAQDAVLGAVPAAEWVVPPGRPVAAPAPTAVSGSRGLIIGAVVAAVVLVGVGGAWVAKLGPFAAGGAPIASGPVITTDPSGSADPSVAPSVTSTPSAPAQLGEDADVHLLTQLLPLDVAPECASAPLAGQEIAALTCDAAGPDEVRYELYAGLSDLRVNWRTILTAESIDTDSGPCTDDPEGEGGWWFEASPDKEEGRFACYEDGDALTFAWTDESAQVRIVFIGSPDGTIGALRDLWLDGDLDPSRDIAALLLGLDGEPATVPPEIVETCERVDETGPQTGAVECLADDVETVRFVRYASRDDLDLDWSDAIKELGFEEDGGGYCGEGEAGESGWNYGDDPDGTHRGRIACGIIDEGTVLAWTNWEYLIGVVLLGDDIAGLYDIWMGDSLEPVGPGAPIPSAEPSATP
jgi:hypothetical protein